MKNSYLFLSLALLFTLNGCLRFGDDEETESPTTDQVNRCISEMYLNPSIPITPLGFKLLGSGIDDAIWFKFITEEKSLSDVFDTTVVDVSKLEKDFQFSPLSDVGKWWDVQDKNLQGGQILLPNVRCMNVGIEKLETGYMIYIMWHET